MFTMKNLLSLFVAIFLTCIMASCNSSTGPDNSFDSYRIGTFVVEEPTWANWDGGSGSLKAKSLQETGVDTFLYREPDQNKLSVFKARPNEDKVYFEYIDSTITDEDLNNSFQHYSMNTDLGKSFPNTAGFTPEGFVHLNFDLTFSCDSTYDVSGDEYLYLTLYESDEETINKVMRFSVGGIHETARDISNCSN